jgi:ABC-type multidrug transport system ATPase subunit
MQLCDRVLLMQDGTITQQGPYADIKAYLPTQDLTETNA